MRLPQIRYSNICQGEELSRQSLLDTASILFITAIWSMLPDVAAFLSHAFLSKASSLLIDLPFSRCMETEADLVGVNLAAKVSSIHVYGVIQ